MSDKGDPNTRDKIREDSDETALAYSTRINQLRIPEFESVRDEAHNVFTSVGTEQSRPLDNAIWSAFTGAFVRRHPSDAQSVLLLSDEVVHTDKPVQVAVVIEINGPASLILGVEFDSTDSAFTDPTELAPILLADAQEVVDVDTVVARREFASPQLLNTLDEHEIHHSIPPSPDCIESRAYRLAIQQFEFLVYRLGTFPAPPDEVRLRDALVAATEVNGYAFTTQQVRNQYRIHVEPSRKDFARFVQELRLQRRWPGMHTTQFD